jgi:hypothetical protein
MNEAPAQPRPAPGKRISFALAVLMHAVLAVFIIYGIHWQTHQSGHRTEGKTETQARAETGTQTRAQAG